MSTRPNLYLFSSSKSGQERLDYVGESEVDVFQLGLPSPEFLPNTITEPDGETIEDVNAVLDNADKAPRRIKYERDAQIVFPAMKEFFLNDIFFSVAVHRQTRIEKTTPTTPSQSDSSSESIGQVPSLTPLHVDPSQIYRENAPSTAPSQFGGKHYHTLDLPVEEKQGLDYDLLKQATKLALLDNPDISTMQEYVRTIYPSIDAIVEIIRENAPEGLPLEIEPNQPGPSIEDVIEYHLIETEDEIDQPSIHEPRISVRRLKSEPVELERFEGSLSDLVEEDDLEYNEFDYHDEFNTFKVRPIIKNKRQIIEARIAKKDRDQEDFPPQYEVRSIERVKKYMSRIKGAILNGDSVSSIMHTIVYNRPVSPFTTRLDEDVVSLLMDIGGYKRPVSHFTARQKTQIGEYLRDLISSEVEKIVEEDHLLSKRVSRSRESDNILPLLIQDIANSTNQNSNTRKYGTPFEEYLRGIMISEEKNEGGSDETNLGRIREFIKFEDNKVSYTKRIRELIKIKSEEVVQGHMYKIAYFMELTSGLQEYVPSVSNSLPDLPNLQSRLFRSYVKRVSAFDSDADAPESKYIREHKNRNGHVKDPRERNYRPQGPVVMKPTVKVDIIHVDMGPIVMRDSLFSDVYLLKR